MKKRDLRIDLVKLFAAGLIIILHVVENSGGMLKHCVYLAGVFGIPLFLMANGYLLYDKDLSFSYFWKTASRYLWFVLLWTFTIGIATFLVKGNVDIFTLFFGAILGTGRLFHLWFLSTLLLILFACCGINTIIERRNKKIQDYVNWQLVAVIVVLMSASCLVDFFVLQPNTSIREIIPASLRLVTNGGFFVIGMFLRRTETSIPQYPQRVYVGMVLLCYVGICMGSLCSSVCWASSFYPSLFCIAGTVAIFRFILSMRVEKTKLWCLVSDAAPASIGVWVLHPFVILVLKKILEAIEIQYSVVLRVLTIPILFVGCIIVSNLMLKIKGVNRLVKV